VTDVKRSLAIVVLLLAGALSQSVEAKQHDADATIVLGGLFNSRGPLAELDVPTLQGAQLAVDRINAAGGVLGMPVELHVEDGKGDLRKLAGGTAKILRQHPTVSAFLGLSDTDAVLAAAQPAADAGRVFLTSGATSPRLPGEIPGYLFLACFGDNVQAAAAAEYAYQDLGARSAAVFYDSSDTYTLLLQQYFRTRFAQLGGVINSVEAYTPDDPAGPIGQLGGADIVFLSAHVAQDAATIVPLLRQAGFAVPIVGGDGFDAEEVWQANPGVANVYYTTHVYLGADNLDPMVVQFRSAFQAAYPDAPLTAFAALGFDAANLLAEAIRRAGSTDPQQVRQSLSGIQDFDGVTGRIGYENGSRIPRKSVSIVQVSAGQLSLARQFLPAGVPDP
jgi:branched-chain amino acid transport system substrate-binding protein